MGILTPALALAAAVASPTTAIDLFRQPAGETKVTLDARQMLEWGARASAQGDQATATRIYRAMQRDSDPDIRAEARFRLAQLLAAAGELSEAATLLRQLLDEQPKAISARFALAQMLVRIGDEAAARRELRALQAGPLPLDAARLVDRFSEGLRIRKPFGASIELAFAPDSNINRATRSDTIGTVIGPFEISEDGQAVSGTGLAVRGQLYKRAEIGETATLLGRLSGAADLYSSSDFNDLALDAAIGPELRLGRNLVRMELGAGRRWFGGEPFVDSARVAASIARPIDRRTQVRATGSVSVIDHKLNDLQDGRVMSGSIGVERALSPTTGVGLSIAGDRQALRDPAYSTHSWRASVIGWREVGRTTLTATIDYGRLVADDRLMIFPDRRRESFARLSLAATFRQYSVRGFAPLVRYSIERNRSSIEIYDYARRRAEFGIARAF